MSDASRGGSESAVRIAVAGAAGRMGRMLIETGLDDPAVEIAGAFEAPGHEAIGLDAGVLAGRGAIGVAIGAGVESLGSDVDALIDFTTRAATLAHLEATAGTGIRMVIGTTGFDDAERIRIAGHAAAVPTVLAPNMSVGVNVCFTLLEQAARVLGEDFDVEIIEAHHRHKVDAPSGTAVRMGEVVAGALGRDLASCAIYGREGHTGPREGATIGFETVRGGDIVGEHTVMFAGAGERVEIAHRSSSRVNFARGAMRAARWVVARDAGLPGLYDMQDVLGLRRVGS